MKDETHERTERGWDDECEGYACRDGKFIWVPHKSANIRDLNEVKRALRNQIRYTAGRKEVRTTVSGIEYDQYTTKIFGGPDDIRTIIFPKMLRTVRQGAFHGAKGLRSAVLNEGLETLGTDEYTKDGGQYYGAFQESALERIDLPSMLKRIEYSAF